MGIMEDKKEYLGSSADQLTPGEKHFKVMGLMTLGFLIKRKNLLLVVVSLGIVTAFVLTYILLF